MCACKLYIHTHTYRQTNLRFLNCISINSRFVCTVHTHTYGHTEDSTSWSTVGPQPCGPCRTQLVLVLVHHHASLNFISLNKTSKLPELRQHLGAYAQRENRAKCGGGGVWSCFPAASLPQFFNICLWSEAHKLWFMLVGHCRQHKVKYIKQTLVSDDTQHELVEVKFGVEIPYNQLAVHTF